MLGGIENSESHDAMIDRVASLHSVFCRIQIERMQDVPLLNLALNVATVGFQRWEDYYLGILITPWMMKLVGLPMQMQLLAQVEVIWQFPSGEYALRHDALPEVGSYFSVSLFSPMGEFRNQKQAEDTAEAVMQDLFTSPAQQIMPDLDTEKEDVGSGMTRRELLLAMFRDKKSE